MLDLEGGKEVLAASQEFTGHVSYATTTCRTKQRDKSLSCPYFPSIPFLLPFVNGSIMGIESCLTRNFFSKLKNQPLNYEEYFIEHFDAHIPIELLQTQIHGNVKKIQESLFQHQCTSLYQRKIFNRKKLKIF